MLCNWLKKLAPLSQPMGIQTKTNRVLAACVFPRLVPVTCICFKIDWLVVLFTSVATGQSNYFGFGFTTLNWKPLYHSVVYQWFLNKNIIQIYDLKVHNFLYMKNRFCLLIQNIQLYSACFVQDNKKVIHSQMQKKKKT